MARVQVSSSKAPCVGMLAGMLLLGIAATMVVMTPKSLAIEMEHQIEKHGRQLLATSDAENNRDHMIYSTESYYTAYIIQALIGVCFAFLYKKNTVDKVMDTVGTLEDLGNQGKVFAQPGQNDFDSGIFDCFGDRWVCIHGLCCPLVRMAHTNAVSGVLGFWETVAAMFCCAFCTGGIGPACLAVYFRKQLKGIMGIEDNLLCDCVVTCFCPYLSICQSGSAVDQAMGYEVTGCCDLEWTGDNGLA